MGLPRGGGGGVYHGSPWGRFEPYLSVFPRQGSKFQFASCIFQEPHVLQMLASKAFGPPKGGRRRGISRLSVGKIRAVLVGFPSAGIKIPIRFMYLSRASCSPNASQQSIWASQGGAAEGYITALRGEDSSRTCRFSLGRDQNSNSLHVSFKSLMFSKC